MLEMLAEKYGRRLLGMAVFGSTARGVATEASDLDFLICATPLPQGRYQRVTEFDELIEWAFRDQWEGAGNAPIDLSPVIRTPEELLAGSPLLFDLTVRVWILRDDGGAIARALDRMRTRLDRAGARRLTRGGLSWWDLKPDFRPGESYSL